MDAFVKSFATYRTIKQAVVLANALTLDSLDMETSTVTVVGTSINRSDIGNWLIVGGLVLYISQVKPQVDRTLLTLLSPIDAFNRPLELGNQPQGMTFGAFVARQLNDNWVWCDDPVYAMPYLSVSSMDTTPYIPPDLDSTGCYNLPDYVRLIRKSYRPVVRFTDAGNTLSCIIQDVPTAYKQVSFDDGRSQLQSVDYSTSGTAKITVLHDVDTGEKDENEEPILARDRTTWYLAEDGSVSQQIPARRAPGGWTTINVTGGGEDEVQAKVIETFSKNKSNHKLEFWSELDLNVHDDCTFFVYGELLLSYISYKRKSSTDKRYYYRSGELATTASEKLRGLKK